MKSAADLTALMRPRPFKPSVGLRLRWAIYRMLESRSGTEADPVVDAGPDLGRPLVWLFVSTIGELNAVSAVLGPLLARMPPVQLVLVTDRPMYLPAYRARFPDAHLIVLGGKSGEHQALIRRFPPALVLLAEMPVSLADAPCRLGFSLLYQIRRRGAPIVLLNGWRYGGKPGCRIDHVEQWLFQHDYVRLIDRYLVQSEVVKAHLLACGANPETISVVGNVKFDIDGRSPWMSGMKSPDWILALQASGRPIIVGGCVTNLDDQSRLLDVFGRLLPDVADALLVLAPRHPENAERMEKLEGFLQERGLEYRFKRRCAKPEIARVQVLVLDTIGELNDFYAISTLCYLGPNHNVLEPLVYGKPVYVLPGWEPSYPSFPVYQQLVAAGVVSEPADGAELEAAWRDYLSAPLPDQSGQIAAKLAPLRGATSRTLNVLEAWVQQ